LLRFARNDKCNIVTLIIVAYLVAGILYAVNTPPWQAPDEPAHYNYIKYLAEHWSFPILRMGDYPHHYLEEIKARQFPSEMSIEPLRYEFHQPPLYYILAAPIYQLFAGSLLPLRLLSVLLGCGVLWVAYRVVEEVFPEDEALALGTVAFIAFVPMHVATTAAVNNDTLAELILAVILWMLIRMVSWSDGRMVGKVQSSKVQRGGGTEETRRLVGLGVLMGLGLLTKITTLIAIPLGLVAVMLGKGWPEQTDETPPPTRGRPGGGGFSNTGGLPSLSGRGGVLLAERLRQYLLPLTCLLLPALLIILPWFVRNTMVYGGLDIWGLGRHDAIVVGQPRTAEWLARLGAVGLAREFVLTTFRSFWAQFGWMGILVDERIYLILGLLSAVAGLGLALFVIRNVRQRALSSPQRMALALLALSALLTLFSYFWYNLKFVQHQGRYLFPALISLGLAFALGLREILARENAKIAAFLLLASVLVLIAKGLVTGDINKLSIFLLGGAAVAFGIKTLVPEKYDDLVFALPYLGLWVLDLICLFRFIVPYFHQPAI